MLSQQENEMLTRVGPGTPMGSLLRRYWMPIALSEDVTEEPVSRRLLGEDLVVFRTLDGRVGVLDERCPHRRTSLTVGVSEEDGLRCGYHGWRFSLDGRCIEQPAERKLNERQRIKAYPAQELGGLVFTYMGPAPAPLLPRFDLFVMEDCIRDIGHTRLDFNWLQAMENSVDPVHAEWLHGHFSSSVRARQGKGIPVHYGNRTHKQIAFDTFEYGIIKRRLLEGGSEEDDGWKIGHPLVFPIMLKIGSSGFQQFQIRVPIDDTTTWHIWYTAYTPETTDLPKQAAIPGYFVPLFDSQGKRILDFIDGQDIAAWAGQGVIADRTQETLGGSDKGVAVLRRLLTEQVSRVQAGQDPIGTVREAGDRPCIPLPTERSKSWAEDKTYMLGFLEAQAVRYSPLNRQLIELFQQYGVRQARAL